MYCRGKLPIIIMECLPEETKLRPLKKSARRGDKSPDYIISAVVVDHICLDMIPEKVDAEHERFLARLEPERLVETGPGWEDVSMTN
jgi:hypothetical protein